MSIENGYLNRETVLSKFCDEEWCCEGCEWLKNDECTLEISMRKAREKITKIEPINLIRCSDCENIKHITLASGKTPKIGYCQAWNAYTDLDGHCYCGIEKGGTR